MKTDNRELVWLVQAAKNGDREAMTVIYERTNRHLRKKIRSLIRDRDLAEDVLQETYLHAFSRIGQLNNPQKLLSWLRSIAINLSKNALAKKTPLLFSELESELEIDPPLQEQTPEQSLLDGERADVIRSVLDSLSEGQRLIVGMYYFEQISTGEIAERLGISQSTVRSQLFHGKRRIAQELRRLRKQGLSPLDCGLFPFFLRQWRRLGERLHPIRPILSRLPEQAAELQTVSALAVTLGKIASVAAALCILGAGMFGAGKLIRLQQDHRRGDVRPIEAPVEVSVTKDAARKTPTETEPIPAETLPEETEPELPDEPDEPKEPRSLRRKENPDDAQLIVNTGTRYASAAASEAASVSAGSNANDYTYSAIIPVSSTTTSTQRQGQFSDPMSSVSYANSLVEKTNNMFFPVLSLEDPLTSWNAPWRP